MAAACNYPNPPCVVRHPRLFSTVAPSRIMVGVKMIGSVSLVRTTTTTRTASPRLQIKSSVDNKVFEDPSEGIVCYVDDSGETVCETYDEGPRFHREVPDDHRASTEGRIIGLLQRNWIQLVDAEDVYMYRTDDDDAIGAELAAREEFNQNGYNFN